MKIVILCGGKGTRIRDVSEVLPKPMLPVGNRPVLWHIMKIYSHYGFNDFVLCLGYKGWTIKEFFLNYQAMISDITIDLGDKNSVTFHDKVDESSWKVTLVDTGEETQTAGRIWGAKEYLKDCDTFGITYGDGVADVNVAELLKQHKDSGLLGTITGVQPLGRFGEIQLEDNVIREFNEKPNVSAGLINGGFMVFEQEVLDKYFTSNKTHSLEQHVIPKIVKDRQVGIYKHKGAWQCIDTPREYNMLNQFWSEDQAFWKVWK